MDNRNAICDGCQECAMRCTDGIKISSVEYARILEVLRTRDQHQACRVLRQDKRLPWFDDLHYTACLFFDIDTRRCLVYPARPLVCRLFGHVRHLPCPTGRAPQDIDPTQQLEAYCREPLATFQQWMAANGHASVDDLFGTTETIATAEV